MKFKVIAPNKDYNGVTATVKFEKGVGETSNPYFVEWLKAHGYKVEEVKADKKDKDDKKNPDKTSGDDSKDSKEPAKDPDDASKDADPDKTSGE